MAASMGGPKKPTLTQAAKRTEKARQQERRETTSEKSILGLTIPSMDDLVSFVKGLRYVTPYVVAERFGFRLSLAKSVLSELAAKGVLKLVTGDNRLRIYVPAQKAAEVAAAPQAKKAKEAKPTVKRRAKKAAAGETAS